MKRNIIKAALFAVFAFVAGYGVYTSQKETSMSERMWRHWLVTRVVVVMIVVIHVLEHFVDILFQRVQLHKLQYITNS